MVIEEKILAQINCNKALLNEQLDEEYDDTFNQNDTELTKERVEPNSEELENPNTPKVAKNNEEKHQIDHSNTVESFNDIESIHQENPLQRQSARPILNESLVGQINVREEVEKDGKMDKKEASLEDALF